LTLFSFKAVILVGVFWLFFNLSTKTEYAHKSVRIAALLWGGLQLFFSIMINGFGVAAVKAVLFPIIISSATFYLVKLLGDTFIWWFIWPLGFFIVLLFG